MTKTPAAKRIYGVTTIPPYFLKASSVLLSPMTLPSVSFVLPPRSWALFFAVSLPHIVSAPSFAGPTRCRPRLDLGGVPREVIVKTSGFARLGGSPADERGERDGPTTGVRSAVFGQPIQ